MDQPRPDELLTIAETASLLKVSTMTVRRWIKAGRLPAHRIGPRTIRVVRRDVDELEVSRGADATSPVFGVDDLGPLSQGEMTGLFDALREAGKLRRRLKRVRGGQNIASSSPASDGREGRSAST